MRVLTGASGNIYKIDKPIDRGGEAEIFAISNYNNMVAKIYFKPSINHETKLKAMLATPPDQPKNHIAVTWPEDVIYQNGNFSGFVMKKINGYNKIIKYYNPANRKKISPYFYWNYLLRTAYNLAVAVETIHYKKHVIGDFNESNILVNDTALVTFVDTDSFQITNSTGNIFRCLVGKPEFTPPEFQGKKFEYYDRTKECDLFALGVMIFKLLMEGRHPFDCTFKKNVSVAMANIQCIKSGLFPYDMSQSKVDPPKNRVSFNQLNPNLQTLFLKCFKDGHRDPSKRPAAYEWKQVLSNAEKNLKKCRKDQSHYYSNHLKKCPLCNTNTQSSVSGRQKPMPVPKKSPPPTTTKVPSQKKISPTTKAPKTTTHSTSSSRLIKWVISCVLIMILGKFLFFKTLNVYDNTYLSWSVFGGCIGLIHYFFFKGKTKNTIPTFLAFACCWALYEPIQQNSDFIIQIANIPKLIVFNRNILEDSGLFFFGMLFGLFQGIILKKQSLFFHLVFFGGIVFFISGLLSIISTYYISEYLIGLSVYLTWNNLDILYWGNFGLYYGIFTGIFIVK